MSVHIGFLAPVPELMSMEQLAGPSVWIPVLNMGVADSDYGMTMPVMSRTIPIVAPTLTLSIVTHGITLAIKKNEIGLSIKKHEMDVDVV